MFDSSSGKERSARDISNSEVFLFGNSRNFNRFWGKFRLSFCPSLTVLSLGDFAKSIDIAIVRQGKRMESSRLNLHNFRVKLVSDFNWHVALNWTSIAQVAKIVVSDRKDAIFVQLLVPAQKVSTQGRKRYVNNIQLFLLEEI